MPIHRTKPWKRGSDDHRRIVRTRAKRRANLRPSRLVRALWCEDRSTAVCDITYSARVLNILSSNACGVHDALCGACRNAGCSGIQRAGAVAGA